MNRIKKVMEDPIDDADLEGTSLTEEKAPVIDQYTADAVAFWRKYLSLPRRKKPPVKFTKVS